MEPYRNCGKMSEAATLERPAPWHNGGESVMRSHSTPEERFWSKVDKSGPIPASAPHLGACWIWMAHLSRDGYGRFWNGEMLPSGAPRTVFAHRWSYEQMRGRVPSELQLDHLCRVRNCVCPTHLEVVTHAENVRRGVGGKSGGARMLAKTHCPQGHPYDAVNTRLYEGRRYCRACGTRSRRKPLMCRI